MGMTPDQPATGFKDVKKRGWPAAAPPKGATLPDRDRDGQLDKTEFVKLYAHFKEKESKRLSQFNKDLMAIQVTKVCNVCEHPNAVVKSTYLFIHNFVSRPIVPINAL